MTERLPFTQMTLRRAIAAARAEGLFVIGIRPDGTVLVDEKPLDKASLVPESGQNTAPPNKWEDQQT